jgi:hypothetical protein
MSNDDRPQALSSASFLPSDEVARARKLLMGAKAWIGWELYEQDRDSICLDGYLTFEELEALVLVMKQRSL